MPGQNPEGLKSRRWYSTAVEIIDDGGHGMVQHNPDRIAWKVWFSVLSGMLQERQQAGEWISLIKLEDPYSVWKL